MKQLGVVERYCVFVRQYQHGTVAHAGLKVLLRPARYCEAMGSRLGASRSTQPGRPFVVGTTLSTCELVKVTVVLAMRHRQQ